MQKKILLNQARNADSDISNITIPVDLTGDKDIIVDDQFSEVVNQYNVYLDEREQCTTVRLTAQVNLIASNRIFNSVTEIVKNEGSNSSQNLKPKFLNYFHETIGSSLGRQRTYEWGSNINAAVMNTEITYDGKDDKNYTYLCGIDIFNNHILRSKTTYPSYYYGNNNSQYNIENYNTISEYLADRNGYKDRVYTKIAVINSHGTRVPIENVRDFYMHRYTKNTIQSYFESLQLNLRENKGWLGFYNKSRAISNSDRWEDIGTSRVINNQPIHKFIDLFPGRDRYSLEPHYNTYRKRYEKNWEYCLTYPSDSTTDGTIFINQHLNTLKIAFIDENEHDDDSVYRCTIYSITKHGLRPDDTINLYRSEKDDDSKSELVEGELVVHEVIDDYVFTVYTSDWVCKEWVSVFDSGVTHSIGDKYIYPGNTGETFVAVNTYINADVDTTDHIGSQNLSFTKTVNGVECQYYVRIFSRFPNFKFYDKEITEKNIYSPFDTTKTVIEQYSELEYEKQSTQTKLGFAKNVYGDDMCQIVFNEDININNIKDNLGRPLTSLYLTFFKTNYGYKEWYSASNDDDLGDEKIEWSRCFGKVNCGFEYSPYIDTSVFGTGNVFVMNNVNDIRGLNQIPLRRSQGNNNQTGEEDDIDYRGQDKFFGDLCMYSPAECLETVIQPCCNRFNTAQREWSNSHQNDTRWNPVTFDEIQYDDYTFLNESFTLEPNITYDAQPTQHPEGYYYYPHYEIPVRSFSNVLKTFNPKMIGISNMERDEDRWIITTTIDSHLDNSSVIALYDTLLNKVYDCKIQNVLDVNILNVIISTVNVPDIDLSRPQTYKLFEKAEVPDYAEMTPGNSTSYRWRAVIPNGFEDVEGIIPEYPFVNGCLYINKGINLFLRRQDPFGDNGLFTQAPYFGLTQVTGERNPVEDGTASNISDSISEEDIKC